MTAYGLWTALCFVMWKLSRPIGETVMGEAPTVPCGIHTMREPRTEQGWLTSYPCGGTCHQVAYGSELMEAVIHYKCDRCGFSTTRYADGRPLRAWDGLLRDGTPYEGSAVSEHDWRL